MLERGTDQDEPEIKAVTQKGISSTQKLTDKSVSIGHDKAGKMREGDTMAGSYLGPEISAKEIEFMNMEFNANSEILFNANSEILNEKVLLEKVATALTQGKISSL